MCYGTPYVSHLVSEQIAIKCNCFLWLHSKTNFRIFFLLLGIMYLPLFTMLDSAHILINNITHAYILTKPWNLVSHSVNKFPFFCIAHYQGGKNIQYYQDLVWFQPYVSFHSNSWYSWGWTSVFLFVLQCARHRSYILPLLSFNKSCCWLWLKSPGNSNMGKGT